MTHLKKEKSSNANGLLPKYQLEMRLALSNEHPFDSFRPWGSFLLVCV